MNNLEDLLPILIILIPVLNAIIKQVRKNNKAQENQAQPQMQPQHTNTPHYPKEVRRPAQPFLGTDVVLEEPFIPQKKKANSSKNNPKRKMDSRNQAANCPPKKNEKKESPKAPLVVDATQPNPIATLLHNPDELKRAFILSEILKRKY